MQLKVIICTRCIENNNFCDIVGQLLRYFLYCIKKAIDFSVGKWSALIKQAKKKQEEQNKTLSQSLQCDENTTEKKIPTKDGKYQIRYLFDTKTTYNFITSLKLDVHIFQKIPLSESFNS